MVAVPTVPASTLRIGHGPFAAMAERRPVFPSGSQATDLSDGLARVIDHQAVDNDHAEREDPQRPEREGPADRQQSTDGADAGGEDPDYSSVSPASAEREPGGELDHT